MIDFDVRCPKNYPLKCNLTDVQKDSLVRSEKYKGFLMYQFEGQTDYVVPKVKEYFKTPLYHLFDAQNEPGLGIKICKICQIALASDFGIASLTPLNNNVFFEVGLMQGLGKPTIYLVDRKFEHNDQKGAKAVPFDLSDQMVIEHETAAELLMKLEKETSHFIDKVQLSTVYEKEFVEFVKKKVNALQFPESKKLLKYFVLERAEKINNIHFRNSLKAIGINFVSDSEYGRSIFELETTGFVRQSPTGWYSLEGNYRDILKELLFKE